MIDEARAWPTTGADVFETSVLWRTFRWRCGLGAAADVVPPLPCAVLAAAADRVGGGRYAQLQLYARQVDVREQGVVHGAHGLVGSLTLESLGRLVQVVLDLMRAVPGGGEERLFAGDEAEQVGLRNAGACGSRDGAGAVVAAVRTLRHRRTADRLPPLVCARCCGCAGRGRRGVRSAGSSSDQAEVMAGAAASSTPWAARRTRVSSMALTSLR